MDLTLVRSSAKAFEVDACPTCSSKLAYAAPLILVYMVCHCSVCAPVDLAL